MDKPVVDINEYLMGKYAPEKRQQIADEMNANKSNFLSALSGFGAAQAGGNFAQAQNDFLEREAQPYKQKLMAFDQGRANAVNDFQLANQAEKAERDRTTFEREEKAAAEKARRMAAENDANSPETLGRRKFAQNLFKNNPEMASSFGNLTAAQLNEYLPFAMKKYETDESLRLAKAKQDAEMGEYAGKVEGLDETGKPVNYLLNKRGETLSSIAAPKPINTENLKFKALPMEAQKEIETISAKTGNQNAITTMIDSQLSNMKKAWESGDKQQAIVAGLEMVKALNSDQGADAVGAEEAKRLSSLLQFQIGNMTNPGPMFGRDIAGFFEQAAQKNNAVKNAMRLNRQRIQDIYEGKYYQDMPETQTAIGEYASAVPKSDGSTAIAAPKSGPKEGQRGTARDGTPVVFKNGQWIGE